jgi:hypothetical protein
MDGSGSLVPGYRRWRRADQESKERRWALLLDQTAVMSLYSREQVEMHTLTGLGRFEASWSCVVSRRKMGEIPFRNVEYVEAVKAETRGWLLERSGQSGTPRLLSSLLRLVSIACAVRCDRWCRAKSGESDDRQQR